MGMIISLIRSGLTWGGPAAIGYFFNDLASFLGNTFNLGEKAVDPSTQKPRLWFVAVVFLVGGILLSFLIKFFSGRRKRLFSLLLFAVVLCVDTSVGGPSIDVITASLLFSIAASVTDTKSVPYCPQFLAFNIGTVPSSMKIEVAGDGVIFSLDGTGITNLNAIRVIGELPSGGYIFRLADGYINKTTTFTIANAHAGQLDVYGWSEGHGTGYVMHNAAQALANASLLVDDFFYAAFPSAAATDTLTISFRNGKTETMTRLEASYRLAQTQEVVSTRYNIDNFARTIRSIQFTGASAQAIYYTRWNRAHGTVRQTLN